jgi:hypothetical protein
LREREVELTTLRRRLVCANSICFLVFCEFVFVTNHKVAFDHIVAKEQRMMRMPIAAVGAPGES